MTAVRLTPRSSALLDVGIFMAAAVAIVGFALATANRPVVVIAALGVIILFSLAATGRLPLAMALFMLYVGLVDGYLKLSTGSSLAVAARDVMFAALVAGWLISLMVRNEPYAWPPLTSLVLAVVAVVIVAAANPDTPGIRGILAGFRQHIIFMPLFFMSYETIRSQGRLRGFIGLLLFIGAINAVVGIVQYNLTPQQFANWGPGYSQRVLGTGNFVGAGRTFSDAAGEHVRPFGLGADAGASGTLGWLAIGGALALLASAKDRRQRIAGAAATAVCAIAIVTAQSRGAVVIGVLTAALFPVLSAGNRQTVRVFLSVSIGILLVYAAVSLFAGSQNSGALSRLKTVTPGQLNDTLRSERGNSIALGPEYATKYPLGVGIGRNGPGAGFGGSPSGLNAETEFNFLIGEVGTIGLLAFLSLWISVLVAAVRATRAASDQAARLLLTAVTTALAGECFAWFQSAPTSAPPNGPLFFVFAGVVAVTIRYGPSTYANRPE